MSLKVQMSSNADNSSYFRQILIVVLLLQHIHHHTCYNTLESNIKTEKRLNVYEDRRYKRKDNKPTHDFISKSILTSYGPQDISQHRGREFYNPDSDKSLMKFSNQSMYQPKYPSHGMQSKDKRSSDNFQRNKVGTKDNLRTQNIKMGRTTSINKHPWFVSVWKISGWKVYFRCGGSVIADRWVLTAAHCLEEGRKGYATVLGTYQIKVMAGTNVKKYFTRKHGGIIYNIAAVHLHPAWSDPNSYIGDVGLLQIKGTFDFSASIGIICLRFSSITNRSSGECMTMGMGLGSDHLLKSASAPIVYEKLLCENNIVKLQFNGSENMRRYTERYAADKICAGQDVIAKPGFCDGDSGSPIACRHGDRWLQEGVTHASLTDCRKEAGYDVYTSVEFYIDWITGIVGELPPLGVCGREKPVYLSAFSGNKSSARGDSSLKAYFSILIVIAFAIFCL